MKNCVLSFFIVAFISASGAVELPDIHFVPGRHEEPVPETHCYDYICSEPFPVPESNYYFYKDGKMCFAFRKKPEQMNLFHEVGGKDPLEGFNRTMFSATNFFMRWIFRPIGMVYCTILPRPAIRAVNNIAENVTFPKRFLSCLLQAKFTDGGISMTRFVFNSSVGVGGAWDASEYFLGLTERDEDFGQAFASWGIGTGCYVFVPGEGPCNLRNAVGKIFDYALDIKSYIYGAQATSAFHKMVGRYEDYEMLIQTSADPYKIMKDFWLIQRKNKVEDHNLNVKYVKNDYLENQKTLPYEQLEHVKMKSYGSQGVEIDTLKAMFFDVQKEKRSLWAYLSLFNTDFVSMGRSCSVKLQKDKDPMNYRFWGQDEKPDAPLILLTPGLGAHYRSSKVLAMAELLHDRGFAVAAISSSFNWHFMETAASTDAPGFLPADAEDTRRAWGKIIRQLTSRDDVAPRRIIYLGYSMGAIQGMYIAKLEEEENTLGVDRYLAINPPVDLIYGVKQLDKYYDVHKQWSRQELIKRGSIAFGKMMAIAKKQYLFHDDEDPAKPSFYQASHHQLDIEKDEAKFLIGYAFRMTLQEIMFSMHRRGKVTKLKTEYKWSNKTDLYNEILNLNFDDYMRTVLMHHHKQRFGEDISEEEFVEKVSHVSHLKSFKDHLLENPDIQIVHTMNDFLLNDENRLWLKDVFKEKIVFFEHGGHLGNLHFRKVHKRMHKLLRPTPVVSPEQQKYHSETYASLAAPYSVPSVPPTSSEFHNPR